MQRIARALVMVVALAAMLGVATAATSSAHLHANSSANHCDLCFTAHLAAHQAPAAQLLHGPEPGGRYTLLLPLFSYQASDMRPCFSRGPPDCVRSRVILPDPR